MKILWTLSSVKYQEIEVATVRQMPSLGAHNTTLHSTMLGYDQYFQTVQALITNIFHRHRWLCRFLWVFSVHGAETLLNYH